MFLRTGDTEAEVLDGTLGFASSYIEQPRALARKGALLPTLALQMEKKKWFHDLCKGTAKSYSGLLLGNVDLVILHYGFRVHHMNFPMADA